MFFETPSDPLMRELWISELRLLEEIELARQHPAFLSHFVKCVDSRSGEVFEFQMLNAAEAALINAKPRATLFEYAERSTPIDLKDWGWQRPYLEWILASDQTITLKGRQLGVTWVWALLALHYLLFRPGADVLVYSIKEDDAIEVVNRIWDMWLSLPPHFKALVKVIKPTRGVRPSTRIELEHPDGRVSTVTGMPATEKAGHSRSAALVIFDEASRQDHARELWKAVIPASGDKGGKIGVVSTANGMSDGRGLGNFFHELWVGAGNANYPTLREIFLGWWLHPERDEEWRENLNMDEESKAEQYPNDPEEAFLMSGKPFFDVDALKYYANHCPDPLFAGRFHPRKENPAIAQFSREEGEVIKVYRLPEKGRKYAIGVDNATADGNDFSVAAVIDLADGAPCAEMQISGEHDIVAEQLHFLGLWYNTARIAIEKQGGYGDTVIAYLRDGHKGRKPYSKLYRHRRFDRTDAHETATLGFPMNVQTRPKVVSELQIWLKDRLFPYVTRGFLREARTFVRRDTKPSPRHADGCNDDRIFAWGIALELYSQYGEHEHDRKKKTRKKAKAKKPKPLYPWEHPQTGAR